MKIKHNSNMKFKDIHLGECFKFEESDEEMFIKILVQDGFEKLKFNAVNLVTGVAYVMNNETEIIAFRDAKIHANG